MKKILVPTDFSANADIALDYAGKLASKANAHVIIMHCCELLQEKYAKYKSTIKEQNKAIVTDIYSKLKRSKGIVTGNHAIRVTESLYNGRGVVHSILQAATDHKADIIIMGTHGTNGMRRKIIGSRAASIINDSSIPVITIPPSYQWSPPQNIALAVRDSFGNTAITKPVFELANLFNGNVSVAVFTEREAEAVEMITRTKTVQFIETKLKRTYNLPGISTAQLTGSNFHDSMQQFVSERKVDILAMITHKRTFLQTIFDSSMTQRMSYYSTIPLLSLHEE